MLKSLKRWFSSSAPKPGMQGIEYWAQGKGGAFRRVRADDGFVIDGAHRGVPWRIEWGATHRPYIKGPELRFIAELGLHRDLHVLVLNRLLMESSEAKVFDEYVEGVQTRIDTQTPTEIRWLVMYSKASASELKSLGVRFGAVSSVKPWLLQWLAGPLSPALLEAVRSQAEADAFVMSIGRGRLSMRLGLREPTVVRLECWLGLFETAMSEAQRVAGEWPDSALPHSSTRPSVWPRDDSTSSRM
jgi:hypothetical protein